MNYEQLPNINTFPPRPATYPTVRVAPKLARGRGHLQAVPPVPFRVHTRTRHPHPCSSALSRRRQCTTWRTVRGVLRGGWRPSVLRLFPRPHASSLRLVVCNRGDTAQSDMPGPRYIVAEEHGALVSRFCVDRARRPHLDSPHCGKARTRPGAGVARRKQRLACGAPSSGSTPFAALR